MPRTTTATSCISPTGAATRTRPALRSRLGEFGYEDTVNPGTAAGTPNGGLPDTGEDANGNGALDLYGRIARNVPPFLAATTGTPCVTDYPNPLHAGTLVTQVLTDASLGIGLPQSARTAPAWARLPSTVPDRVKPLVARANRPLFFRRALKIVNGGLGNLPNGLTIASENPVYVQGNYNAQANNTLADPHVPAAIIADAVTLAVEQLERHAFVRRTRPILANRRRDDDGLSRGDRRWQECAVPASHGLGVGAGLRHRRRRAQLPSPAGGWNNGSDAQLPRLDRQLLHQPAGGRKL